MNLQEALKKINSEDTEMVKKARQKWDSIAKPLGSLGLLEDTVTKIVALTGDISYSVDKRAVAVMCADNGVVAQGVTQTGTEVTGIVAKNMTTGDTSVCHMAKIAHAEVFPVDIGICTDIEAEKLISRKVMHGTNDMTKMPAMTKEQCIDAIEVGINFCEELKKQGYKIIATGEMGIGNTTTSSAVASVLLGVEPTAVTGKGAGLSSDGLKRKISAIERAIEINKPNCGDAIDVLSKVGGLDIAGLAGVFIGGAALKMPILIDGFISAVAALVAIKIEEKCKFAIVASHVSAEPAGKMLLEELNLKPLLTAQMCLGEGTGAVAVLPLIDMAFDIYNTMSTFSDIKIESYEHLN